MELERWLSSSEPWLFFWTTGFQYPVPTQQLTVICNSCPRESSALFWSPQVSGIHVAHRHMCRLNTHAHKMVIKNVRTCAHFISHPPMFFFKHHTAFRRVLGMVGRWGGDLGRRGIWEQFGTTKQTPKSHLLQNERKQTGREGSELAHRRGGGKTG